MTSATETPVTVEQCDIDRAEALYPPWMHNRLSAINALSQDFARHRIDATRELAAELELCKARNADLFNQLVTETVQRGEAMGLLKPFSQIGEMEQRAGLMDSVMVNVAHCRAASAFLSRTGDGEPVQETPKGEDKYLIRKGAYWYRPKAQGYTANKVEAGRFSLEEALSYSFPNGPDGPRDNISYEFDDSAEPVQKMHERAGR